MKHKTVDMVRNIPVQTPDHFAEIDFAQLASAYGGPVHVITDLEGTVMPWTKDHNNSSIEPDIQDALGNAVSSGSIEGIHGITNRVGKGGFRASIALQEVAVSMGAISLICYPLTWSDRKLKGMEKPSGKLAMWIHERVNLRLAELYTFDGKAIYLNDPRSVPSVYAFVGDKNSDMKEAEMLFELTGVPVVGFMVPRLGDTDHPMDRIFGKRKKANTIRAKYELAGRHVHEE